MQEQKHVIDCYDKTAENYAGKFINELHHKHLDRILLTVFAQENREKGKLIDLGCGPGQATRFLADCGLTNCIGVDISVQMVNVAQNLNPDLHFEIADMLQLHYPDHSFGSALAFYAIVHFDYLQIKTAFQEISRVLIANGQFLFSFHVGEQTVHLDTFLDHPVNIDFHFFETSKITSLLQETGFEIIDVLERQPYPEVEYPSKRAYIWAMNKR
ncbi:class I SAM-dependent methyltransferase [Rhodocytophaga rosea]|uniref:Class I SAM-dependent methyltransferase n=1 Tax=Rhodocytophaga rosea TaxID=2704465 RepID=A0A6C0GD36_9BACT|nr:class I SAM-dependent methyltransferase [Rhodocytophaga rosea]QHT65798.1 class I SAM-dependent methyltransferase [Rhodocytophaga rosea]